MTLVWRPGFSGLTDADAIAYVAAVEAADGEPLEYGVARAINDFVLGCKNDGIWSAIKASCILAGARTLNGALVPLVGAAPTNVGPFVSGDYNRETGLVGDGSTKYLNSNRNNNADPQNSKHVSIYASFLPSSATKPMLALNRLNTEGQGATLIYNTLTRLHDGQTSVYSASTGFIGLSRSNSANYVRRNNSLNTTLAESSFGPLSRNIILFADTLQNAPAYSNARLSFYSIGEALDLALLDTRVTRLMNLITYTQTAGLPDLSTMDLDAAAYIGGAYRAGGILS